MYVIFLIVNEFLLLQKIVIKAYILIMELMVCKIMLMIIFLMMN